MRSCMESSVGQPGRGDLDPEAGAGGLDGCRAAGGTAGACMVHACSADSRLWPLPSGRQALGVQGSSKAEGAAQSRRPSARHMMHLPGGGRRGQAAPCPMPSWPYLLVHARKDGPTVSVT
jgi:hypothetical protein